jgi:hypothetical protein
METIYKERIAESKTISMQGIELFALRNTLPIYRKGLQLKHYEIETLFRDSKKQWIVKFDTLEDRTEQLIILKSKF